MMKSFLFIIMLLIFIKVTCSAQNSEDSVKAVINKLFMAMKTSDGKLLKTCFADSAILQTVARNKAGETIVSNEMLDEFITSVSGAAKNDLDERITFDVVKTDGALAIAWTPYSFYYKTKFSHCGVNAFQLVKIKNEWMIQYLIDTRRKTDCK